MKRVVLPLAVLSVLAGAGSAVGAFGAPVTLSAAGQNATFPQIAVGPDDAATVVWPRSNGLNGIIQAATRPAASATFAAAVDLSATGQNAQDPQVAFGLDGATTVVWRRWNGSEYIVQSSTRPAGSSTFGAAVDLSAAGTNANNPPHVAVGPDGATTVVWVGGGIARARTRPPGSSTFGATVDLSAAGADAFGSQVAVGPDGATTVVWYRDSGTDRIVQARTRPAGSSMFAAAVDLSAPGARAYDPQVAIGPDGATTVVWDRPDGSNDIVQARTRPAASSTFAAAVDLSAAGGDAYEAQVAVGPDGATTVVWYRYDGSNYIVQARTRPAGSSTFGAAVDLSAAGGDARAPQVAVGPDGAFTAVWYRNNGSNDVIQASTSTPTLARLSVGRSGAGSGSVSSSPAGISCGTACAAYFPIGSNVTLSAVPAAGSTFAGWSGACTGTASSCTVAVSAPASVSAAFAVTGASPAAAPTVKVKKTVRTVGRSKITLKSSVLVGEAGKITQKAVRRGGKKQTLCTASRKVNGPGTFSVTCTMGSKVRNQLRSGAIKYTLLTRITTASGASASTTSSATMPRMR